MIKYKRKLNVIAADPPEPIRLGQYDDDVVLEFELYSSEGVLTMEPDTAVAIRGIKPDGNGISVEGLLKSTKDKYTKAETHTACIDVTKQMTACAGECMYKLVLTSNGKELNTGGFLIIVDRAALDKDAVPSESEIREIVETLDRTDDLLTASRTIINAKKEIDQAVETVQVAKDAAVEAAKTAEENNASMKEVLTAAEDVRKAIAELEAAKVAAVSAVEDSKTRIAHDVEVALDAVLKNIETARVSMIGDIDAEKIDLKAVAKGLMDDIQGQCEDIDEKIEALTNAGVKIIEEIEDAGASADADFEKKKKALKDTAENLLANISANSNKTMTEIEKTKESAIGSLDAIQQTAMEQISAKLSQIEKTRDTTADALRKITERMDALQKSIDDLAQAHKDMKARVEHMEFEMFKTGGEEA